MPATSLRDTLARRINDRLFYGWVSLAVAAPRMAGLASN